jgi:hypothetical protein
MIFTGIYLIGYLSCCPLTRRMEVTELVQSRAAAYLRRPGSRSLLTTVYITLASYLDDSDHLLTREVLTGTIRRQFAIMPQSTVKLSACQVTRSSLESGFSLQAKLDELHHPSVVS